MPMPPACWVRTFSAAAFRCDFYSHYGAGAYICGEETALLNSLMGELGQPWSKPPFPAIEGLYHKPTVVNNVETLANVPPVIVNGADWYTAMGTDQEPRPQDRLPQRARQ